MDEPAIPFLGIDLREMKTRNSKSYLDPHVHCSVIHNSQGMETASLPTRGRTDEKAAHTRAFQVARW